MRTYHRHQKRSTSTCPRGIIVARDGLRLPDGKTIP
jgi:hypothetical protein